MKVYLDNAATTPMLPEVVDAMLPYMTAHFGNPSATHSFGRETRAAIEKARKEIARYLNAKASEIIFTSGGTESNNLALTTAVRELGVERIITSRIEHHCVLHTVAFLGDCSCTEIEYVNLEACGKADLQHLKSLLAASDKKTLVSLMHGNNEVGAMNDLQAIGELCSEFGAYFHSDTVQTMAHYPFNLAELKVHFLTGSAHKFHGPKGIGFLFARKGLKVKPIIHGGGQERSKRAGTENLYGIVGMAKAMEIAFNDLEADSAYILNLKNYMYNQLKESFDIKINGSLNFEESLYTVLNVSFPPDSRGSLLLFNLDMEGVCASGGSACSSGAASGSHVLKNMEQEADRISIRFSFSKLTTKEEIDFAVDKIKKIFKVEVPC